MTDHNNEIKIDMILADIERDPIYPNGKKPYFDEKHECLILSLDGDCQYEILSWTGVFFYCYFVRNMKINFTRILHSTMLNEVSFFQPIRVKF